MSDLINGNIYTFTNGGADLLLHLSDDNSTVVGHPIDNSSPKQQWLAIRNAVFEDRVFNLQNMYSNCYLTHSTSNSNGPVSCTKTGSNDSSYNIGWTFQYINRTEGTLGLFTAPSNQSMAFLQSCTSNNCPILTGSGSDAYHSWTLTHIRSIT